jgi:hypothetical protein
MWVRLFFWATVSVILCPNPPLGDKESGCGVQARPTDIVGPLIARYYDAFNSGDTKGMLACLIDDVRHVVNSGARRVGKGIHRALCPNIAPLQGAVLRSRRQDCRAKIIAQ